MFDLDSKAAIRAASASFSSRALAAIEGTASGPEASKVGRVLGRVLSDLRFAELGQILGGDLHAFNLSTLGGVCSVPPSACPGGDWQHAGTAGDPR